MSSPNPSIRGKIYEEWSTDEKANYLAATYSRKQLQDALRNRIASDKDNCRFTKRELALLTLSAEIQL